MTERGEELKEELKKEALARAPKSIINNNNGGEKSQGNQSKILVDLALVNTKLFCDQFNEAFACINTDKGSPITKIRSRFFKNWLSHQFYMCEHKVAGLDTLGSALNTLCGHAQFEGNKYDLHIRTAKYNKAIWYDLCNENQQAIKISDDGWKIIRKAPILFRRYSHQASQVKPSRTGDIEKLTNYINLKSEDDWLLTKVWLVFALVPDLPHPIRVLYGDQGSGKTITEKIIRALIDPSEIDVISLPRSERELTQVLAHHWFLPFDNVGLLTDNISDLLCRVVTGSGFSKRELYSDDDDIIYRIKRCISLNGINIVARKPDLLERSILIECKKISKKNRRTEKEIWEAFAKDRPIIFGGILDILSKSMSIIKSTNLQYKPRMADFAEWGEAIAQAMDYADGVFLKAYFKNIKSQYSEAIDSHLIGQAVKELMNKQKEWSGTPAQLLEELDQIATELKINPNDKMWPKAPNSMSRRLNEIKSNLAEIGIFAKQDRKSTQRNWVIKKK